MIKALVLTGLFSVGLAAANTAAPKLSFQLPADYHEATGKQKLAYLWKQIEKTEYQEMPTYKTFNGSVVKDIVGLIPQQLALAFSNPEDVVVAGRQKMIHKLGSTAWFKFESSDKDYESFEGLIRVSNALNPEKGTLYPSFSIKIPMDKEEPSLNFHIGKSMDPQRIDNNPKGKPDFNFFRDDKLYPFSNELPYTPTSTLGRLFKWVLDHAHSKPNYLPVDVLAGVMKKPAPRRLIFKAPKEIQELMSSDHYEDERVAMARIPVGAVLFEMYESTGLNDDGKLVGKIVLQTRLIASSFGDRNLNFRHDGRDLKTNAKK
jgi:hypothetical protein